MFQLLGGMRAIASHRRGGALHIECALRSAFGQDTKRSSWPMAGGRRYLQVGRALGRASIGALTGGSKCGYIQSLARLPPPARLPGCAVGNEAAGHTGGFARL